MIPQRLFYWAFAKPCSIKCVRQVGESQEKRQAAILHSLPENSL